MLKSRLLSGEMSVLEFLAPVEPEDYRKAVKQRRALQVLGQDRRVLDVILRELETRAAEAIEGGDDINDRLTLKDGIRRFTRLTKERSVATTRQASLLTGETFEACLTQYKSLIEHVEAQWHTASDLCLRGKFPLAAFVSILVIEEIGKLTHLGDDLIWFDLAERRRLGTGVATDHRKKQLIGVLSGALVNARLDRVLGLETVRRILNEAEHSDLERTRQNCLYIDVGKHGPLLPTEAISAVRARELTVLAGELMAEVLGYFPWEFDRMLDNVVRFEIDLGMPEARVSRRATLG